jgi:hypothetical protein
MFENKDVKKCEQCGKEISGRWAVRKRFCRPKCRFNFHNAIKNPLRKAAREEAKLLKEAECCQECVGQCSACSCHEQKKED